MSLQWNFFSTQEDDDRRLYHVNFDTPEDARAAWSERNDAIRGAYPCLLPVVVDDDSVTQMLERYYGTMPFVTTSIGSITVPGIGCMPLSRQTLDRETVSAGDDSNRRAARAQENSIRERLMIDEERMLATAVDVPPPQSDSSDSYTGLISAV